MIPESVQQQRDLDRMVAQFEGLVYETARQIVAAGVELELDDVRQLLRIKILYAIERYNPERSRLPLRRFVFGCVANMRKDIENRPRRFNSSVEQLREGLINGGRSDSLDQNRADSFDLKYLSVGAEQVFFEAEDEEPAWMASLTAVECEVVRLRGDGLTLSEIDRELGLGRDRARFVMQSVREKLAEWRPLEHEPRSVPMLPLPAAEPRTSRPQLAQAA